MGEHRKQVEAQQIRRGHVCLRKGKGEGKGELVALKWDSGYLLNDYKAEFGKAATVVG